MTWSDAVDIVVAETRHERFRTLCSDDNPDVVQRDAYREIVMRRALGLPEPAAAQSAVTSHIVVGCCGSVLPG